jgi:hypothetical protein
MALQRSVISDSQSPTTSIATSHERTVSGSRKLITHFLLQSGSGLRIVVYVALSVSEAKLVGFDQLEGPTRKPPSITRRRGGLKKISLAAFAPGAVLNPDHRFDQTSRAECPATAASSLVLAILVHLNPTIGQTNLHCRNPVDAIAVPPVDFSW